ncbi:hypothetical protein ABID95_008045 [Streptomyces atratus]|uniref:hypothetical protein n=1 Tax=Streptomyces atratus TaxID=1893 RepID=UPI0033984303
MSGMSRCRSRPSGHCLSARAWQTAMTASFSLTCGISLDLLVGFPNPNNPDDDEIDDIAWSVSPDANEHRLILAVGWSRAENFSRAVFALAQKHGLTCFDPQRNEVHNPSAP